jgi:hypothetical protein
VTLIQIVGTSAKWEIGRSRVVGKVAGLVLVLVASSFVGSRFVLTGRCEEGREDELQTVRCCANRLTWRANLISPQRIIFGD